SLFDKSEQRFQEGRFQEAVELLLQAYALDPSPVLLYNVARAYEGLGDLPHAIEGYRRYLDSDPQTEDRAAIERRIATREQQQRDREALERQRATPVSESPPPAPRSVSPVPWIFGAVGLAGVGVGIVLGVLAQSRHDSAVQEPNGARSEEINADAKRLG